MPEQATSSLQRGIKDQRKYARAGVHGEGVTIDLTGFVADVLDLVVNAR